MTKRQFDYLCGPLHSEDCTDRSMRVLETIEERYYRTTYDYAGLGNTKGIREIYETYECTKRTEYTIEKF